MLLLVFKCVRQWNNDKGRIFIKVSQRFQIPQLKTHQCKKFKFWRRWLLSAGQADRCTHGRARTYLISMSLYQKMLSGFLRQQQKLLKVEKLALITENYGKTLKGSKCTGFNVSFSKIRLYSKLSYKRRTHSFQHNKAHLDSALLITKYEKTTDGILYISTFYDNN